MDRQPKIIFWETTRKCNLSCAYCRMSGSSSAAELTAEESIGLVDDIAREFGKALLIFSGGEPLLRNDIFDIIGRASGIGLPVALATNGTLLGENEARSLKKLGSKRVSLSIDSVDENMHDSSRGVKGAFGKTVAAAVILRKLEVPFQINFTVTGTNVDEIRSVADFAVSLGAVAVHYFVLVPVGCGRELRNDEILDPIGTERALEAIRAVSRQLHIEVRPTCAPQYIRIAPDSKGGGCLAGTGALFISAEGDIYPCGYLPVKAGSVREGSIGSIWRGSEIFRRLRQNDLSGSCANCDLKDACRGCRARAYSATGDMMSCDPSCAHKGVSRREKEQQYSSSEAKIMVFDSR